MFLRNVLTTLPGCGAMELSDFRWSSLRMQPINILGDQPFEVPVLLHIANNPMTNVRFKWWKRGPRREIPRPVAVSFLRIVQEIMVLNGPLFAHSVLPNPLWTVIPDPRFRRQSRPGEYEEFLWLVDESTQRIDVFLIHSVILWHKTKIVVVVVVAHHVILWHEAKIVVVVVVARTEGRTGSKAFKNKLAPHHGLFIWWHSWKTKTRWRVNFWHFKAHYHFLIQLTQLFLHIFGPLSPSRKCCPTNQKN